MQKVIVIGCPGAGKSTFARALAAITSLPLYHLDMIWYKPDKTNITKEEFDQSLQDIMQTDAWIIDGNYNRTLDMRLKACDTVFLLDFPLEVCLAGIAARRGKTRPDMPWVEEEPDAEFMQFIKDFSTQTLPKIYQRLQSYPDRENHIFHTREETEAYLSARKSEQGE